MHIEPWPLFEIIAGTLLILFVLVKYWRYDDRTDYRDVQKRLRTK